MSERRPPEDPWSEVLEQVEVALDDAGIGDEPDRAVLLDGVRSALDALVGMDTRDGPGVVVVEGGRRGDDPPTQGAAPPLRVAGADAPDGGWPEDDWEAAALEDPTWAGARDEPWTDAWPDADDQDDAPDDAGDGWETGPRVIVRVPAPGSGGPFPLLGAQGCFALTPSGPAQTLFVGPVARAYRVACSGGVLSVGVDGGAAVRVQPGCSVDVEARQVTVRAAGDADARGRYVRLGLETA